MGAYARGEITPRDITTSRILWRPDQVLDARPMNIRVLHVTVTVSGVTAFNLIINKKLPKCSINSLYTKMIAGSTFSCPGKQCSFVHDVHEVQVYLSPHHHRSRPLQLPRSLEQCLYLCSWDLGFSISCKTFPWSCNNGRDVNISETGKARYTNRLLKDGDVHFQSYLPQQSGNAQRLMISSYPPQTASHKTVQEQCRRGMFPLRT